MPDEPAFDDVFEALWFGTEDLDGLELVLPMQVLCPAGEFPLRLRARTIRSTLRAIELGRLATRPLPPEVAAMRRANSRIVPAGTPQIGAAQSGLLGWPSVSPIR